jgi:rare lipoprotein A
MKTMKLIFACIAISLHIHAQKDFVQTGNASIIEDKFVGRYTANGEKYSHEKLTAAHLTLPFGTKVRVVNLRNSKSVVVRINDRGPFEENRIIDLSKSAAQQIGLKDGTAKVRIEQVNEQDNKIAKEAPANESQPVETVDKSDGKSAFFEISSKTIHPSGFGVQIASYREPSNLLRLASDLETMVGYPPIVQIAENEDGKTFRIMVGIFNSRNEAEKAQTKLAENYPECYVVSFKKPSND